MGNYIVFGERGIRGHCHLQGRRGAFCYERLYCKKVCSGSKCASYLFASYPARTVAKRVAKQSQSAILPPSPRPLSPSPFLPLSLSQSVCVYRDMKPGEPEMSEDEAIPANPDNEYGWEKLYAERVAMAYGRNHGMKVRIARFQNCYGPEGTHSRSLP